MTWAPNWSLPPGAHLAEWLEFKRMSVREFVAYTGIDEVLLLGILAERAAITDAAAALLEAGTTIPARFWLALQHNRDVHQQRRGALLA